METIHGEFLRVAQAFPDAPAVVCETGARARAMTYRQLADYSGRIAGLLVRAGVRPGDRVALLPERGFDPVAMALGVARAGAAFAFPGASLPPDRLRAVLEDLSAVVVLCHSRNEGAVPSGFTAVAADRVAWRSETPLTLECAAGADSALTVVYTSGTTGRPKGVVLTHANMLAFCRMDIAARRVATGARMLAQADMAFDAFLWNIFPPLLAGASVFMMDAEARVSLHAIHEFMLRHRVEHAFLTTRLAEEYLREYDNPHLKTFVLGGEKMRPVPVRGREVWNMYGPTECTVYVTARRVTGCGDETSIGRELGENRIFIVDAAGGICPDGAEGEICVSGPQVSPGYLNLPDLTAERFAANPVFDSRLDAPCHARMYRTGDLGARLPNGEIAFRGRADRQVKIRGFRIEPEEIETALRRHPDVDDAVVIAREGAEGGGRLVGYCVSRRDGGEAFSGEMRAHLAEVLPAYMIPAFFAVIPCVPLRANGKVNTDALPAV